jgi:hypothetical protein
MTDLLMFLGLLAACDAFVADRYQRLIVSRPDEKDARGITLSGLGLNSGAFVTIREKSWRKA